MERVRRGPEPDGDGAAVLRLVRRSYWELSAYLDDRRGRSGLTDRQWALLELLKSRGSCTPKEVCQALEVTAANITGLSTRLRERGFLERTPDTQDRRRVLLLLTPRGEVALRRAMEMRAERLEALMDRLTPAERKGLVGGLERLLLHLTLPLEPEGSAPPETALPAQAPSSGK